MTVTVSADVSETFLNACQQHRERAAVVSQGGVRVTYDELAERVRARAEAIDSVLPAKVRTVGLYGDNSVEYLVSYYATVHCGRVPFLIDPQFAKHELEQISISCGLSTFLVDQAVAARFPLLSRARHLVDTDLRVLSVLETDGASASSIFPTEDTATCRFTSGTTGTPKCLEFSHRAVLQAAVNWIEGTGLAGGDRTLCLAGFSNGLAFNTSLLPTFLIGAELHIHEGLPSSAKIRQRVSRSRVTRLVAFPLLYRLISDSQAARAEEFRSLSMGISAGAVLPPLVRRTCRDRLRIRIADYYGIAEAGPCTFEADLDRHEGLGEPLPGVSIRLHPQAQGDTEVLVKTESMATRYLNLPGLFEERLDPNGYYRTGDIGYIQSGRLFLAGRSSGAINVAGRKIDPVEVEQAALRVPGVEDAVAFEDKDGSDATALHLVVASTRPVSRSDVVRTCRGRLSAYKIPAKVTRVPEIPRSAVGKVNMGQLRRLTSAMKDNRDQKGGDSGKSD
jgi:acyl-CoA synthetase (AMP-forming)/AMP-acid ligase II